MRINNLILCASLALIASGCMQVRVKEADRLDGGKKQFFWMEGISPFAQDVTTAQSEDYLLVGRTPPTDKYPDGKPIYVRENEFHIARADNGIIKANLTGMSHAAVNAVVGLDRNDAIRDVGREQTKQARIQADGLVKAAPLYKPDQTNISNNSSNQGVSAAGGQNNVKVSNKSGSNSSSDTNVDSKLMSQTEGAKINAHISADNKGQTTNTNVKSEVSPTLTSNSKAEQGSIDLSNGGLTNTSNNTVKGTNTNESETKVNSLLANHNQAGDQTVSPTIHGSNASADGKQSTNVVASPNATSQANPVTNANSGSNSSSEANPNQTNQQSADANSDSASNSGATQNNNQQAAGGDGGDANSQSQSSSSSEGGDANSQSESEAGSQSQSESGASVQTGS